MSLNRPARVLGQCRPMRSSPVPTGCFLGPKSENAAWLRDQLDIVFDAWFEGRRRRFPGDDAQPAASDAGTCRRTAESLHALLAALDQEVPTYTPRYLGHMVSDPALPALLGHVAALLHNPNNTSREAAKVGTAIEAEAIAMLARMIGYDPGAARGHFTSGGTVANLEAVWRARFRLDHRLALGLALAEAEGRPLDVFAAAHMTEARFQERLAALGEEAAMRACSGVLNNPYEIAERLRRASGRPYRGPVIIAPGHRHYSWIKAANVFGLGEAACWTAPLDADGRLDAEGLMACIRRARAEHRPILMVVGVAGTTELGAIDPVDKVAGRLEALREAEDLDIWLHVDAAYGGFFCTLAADEPRLAPERRRALAAIRRADSVTVDPHKLGYVPYACGALLVRDSSRDAVSSFAAPYVERAELGEAPWTRTLEGSRPATGAAAVWMMGRSVGFGPEGLGAVLRGAIEGRAAIAEALAQLPDVRLLEPADTNILCFSIAAEGEALSAANARTSAAHAWFAASPNLSLSRTVLGTESAPDLVRRHVRSFRGRMDSDRLVLLRCVVMNPLWGEADARARLLPQLVSELRSAIDAGAEAAGRRAAAPA